MKHKFVIIGKEILERDVVHYKGTASRVFVPKEWKKVVVVKKE